MKILRKNTCESELSTLFSRNLHKAELFRNILEHFKNVLNYSALYVKLDVTGF